MSNFDIEQIQPKMDEIVRDYIYLLLQSRNRRQNYFSNVPTPDDQASFYHSQGFQVLYKDLANKYIVKEEALLEGHTRAFLINPIIDYLLGCQGVRHEWHYGSTFSDPYISNRVHELDTYVEFIFEYQRKTVGCRYTPDSYTHVIVMLDRDFNFLYRNAEIPGFEQLKVIDELWIVDWSGISAEALAATNKRIPGLIYRCRNITAKDFFDTLFGEGVFRIFRETASNAIKDATDIIALKAVPQLLPNNMMTFKDLISAGFSEEETNRFSYIFQEPGTRGNLPAGDLTTIQTMFHENGCGAAIAGDADFAKSFITSEYLFQILKEGLGIDYTAVVVGYLKSVEQLLFLYYISAFDGKNKLRYWDECKPPMKFDPSDPSQYRYAPYNKRKKQAFYCHAKCTDSAPDFGHLSYFLRDNDFLWKVSNQGVEYIYNCLDDFRKSCRNSHFHKDNIPYTEYKEVKRIRNNAKVCIFYLLGGFNLLDSSQSAEKQLGVVDDSFDRFYKTVRQEGRRLFWVENVDGYTGLIYYLNQDAPATYSESGRICDAKLKFVKLPSADRNGAFVDEIQSLCQSKEYTDNNMMVITRETMPTLIVPERVRRKPRGSSGSNSGNSSSDNDSGDTSADTQTTQIDYPEKILP